MQCKVCGFDLEKNDDKRSVQQIRRYFAMLRAFFQHWPEYASFQPESVEHLRAWVQVKCGHYDVTTHDEGAGLTSVKSPGPFAFVARKGDALNIYCPRSISFAKLGHRQACELFDAAQQILEAETGLNAAQVLKETEAAA